MSKQTMIAVFGGTGKLGTQFVQQALEAGYTLRVLVRNPATFQYADHANVELVVGDATVLEYVEQTVSGADIVLSCLGGTSKTLVMEAAYDNIMRAVVKEKQVPRCIMISSIGIGGSSWLIKMMLTLIGGKAGIDDLERADERIREESDVPFVLVRPYALTDKPGIGGYKILPGKTGTFARPISRSDVALFFLHCLEDRQWDGNTVMLGGQKK